jgi:hypothetical protein
MFTQIMNTTDPFLQLRKSEFRRSFHMTPAERRMVEEKGFMAMRDFVYDVIDRRLNTPFSEDDGHQTPKMGHPVFVAQHATATCCRKCLFKWHRIPRHRELTEDEKTFLAGLLLRWIKKDLAIPQEQIALERRAHIKKMLRMTVRNSKVTRSPRAAPASLRASRPYQPILSGRFTSAAELT